MTMKTPKRKTTSAESRAALVWLLFAHHEVATAREIPFSRLSTATVKAYAKRMDIPIIAPATRKAPAIRMMRFPISFDIDASRQLRRDNGEMKQPRSTPRKPRIGESINGLLQLPARLAVDDFESLLRHQDFPIILNLHVNTSR